MTLMSFLFSLQCKAEAQEITIARAIELKHSAKLISSLSNETAKIYGNCGNEPTL